MSALAEKRPSLNVQPWLLGCFLVAVTLMAYQPLWHAGFIWDDSEFVTKNPAVQSSHGLYRLWFTGTTSDYYPMTLTLFWLEWRLWGANPLGYHLVNVLLHACSAVLFWRVLQRLKIPGALLAAAIFALHPVNVESVAWIAEGKNTLCLFFYAGTLLVWLKYEDSGQGRWYGLALAGFALSLLSKTATAPLPLVLLGVAWWRRGRVEWKDVRRIVPFFVIAAAWCPVTAWLHYHRAIRDEVVRADGFWSRLAGAGWAVWFYLYKAVLPLNLAFVYPRWQIDPRNVLSYIPLALIALAFVLCWRCRRVWGRAPFFGLAYFVVMLLPILGFLNIYFMLYSLVADHWQYFAMIAPAALAAAIIRRPVPAAALLLTLGVLTWKQCGIYASEETLWQATLRHNPDCWMAHVNLGVALSSKEKQADEAIGHFQKALQLKPDCVDAHYNLGNALLQKGKVDEAISHYQTALQLKPDKADAHDSLGRAFSQLGRLDEAILQYQKALEIQPGYADAHNHFGLALLEYGRVDEAISQFQTALQLKPGLAEAHNNLGNALLQKGGADEAISQFQTALQLKPGLAEARNNLGNALLQKGRVDEAISQFQTALQINPAFADAHLNLGIAFFQKGGVDEAIAHFQDALQIAPANVKALNDLAWVLATCPQAALRDGNKAVKLAQQANALTNSKNPVFLSTLAAAFAEAGRFDDAAQTAQNAMDLAQAAEKKGLTAQLNSQLQRYKAGLPLHQ